MKMKDNKTKHSRIIKNNTEETTAISKSATKLKMRIYMELIVKI